MEINPSFGQRSYWHLVDDAPLEDSDTAASALWRMVTKFRDDPAHIWPIQPCVVRAMALELVVGTSNERRPLSTDLVFLLAWSSNVPALALADPPTFYDGGWSGGSPANGPSSKNLANWIDRDHFQKTGSMLAVARLRSMLAEMLGEDAAPARASLRSWREETDYGNFVRFNERNLGGPGET